MSKRLVPEFPPIVPLQIRHTQRSVEIIRHWRDEGALLLDAPYQRGDVWGLKRQVNLIRSLLCRIPIPSIVTNDRLHAGWPEGSWQYAVIDGRQRCTAILRFMDSRLYVPGNWFGFADDHVLYGDLPISQQRKFKHMSIAVAEANLPTLDGEQEVFDLINFGGLAQGESDF